MTIQREGTRMNHIISQLLMLTRGYEGRYYVEKEWITLRDMLDSIIDELSDMATEANIRLKMMLPGTRGFTPIRAS
jgi:signal transduction histidine kinase